MRRTPRVVRVSTGLLAPLLAACVLDLVPPDSARISCQSDAECPERWHCSTSIGECVSGPANQAPSVTIAPIERSIGIVTLAVTVFDEEANPTLVSARLIAGDRTFDLELPSTELESAPDGVTHTVSLDVARALGETTYKSGLTLALTPRDKTGIGATVVSEPFAFGNDPPRVARIDVDGDGGVVAVSMVVDDSSADSVSVIDFSYSLDDFQTVRSVPLDADDFGDTGVLTIDSPDGAAVIPWNTAKSAALSASRLKLRVTVRDSFGAESEPSISPEFVIDNAPRLALFALPAASRRTSTIPFIVDASDPSVPGAETFALELEYATGGATFLPLTLGDAPNTAAFSPGQSTLTWDALQEASGSLPAHDVDTSDGQSPKVPILRYADRLGLRAQLVDSSGLASARAAVELGPVGNDPPAARIVTVSDDPRYNVALSIVVADTSFDPADVEVQFKEPGDSQYRTAALVLSNTEGLATGPSGVTHLLLWDSAAEPAPLIPSMPQGVGYNVATNVDLRVRAIDRAGGGATRYYGEWSLDTRLPMVRNQSAPRVDGISFERLVDSDGSSPVAIRYTVIDEESDPVDVSFALSFDGGPFGPCPELPSPLSEDTRGLMSSPGGVEHVFVWNPTADRIRGAGAVELRITARDAKYATTTTQSTERLFPRPAQATFAPPNTGRYGLFAPTGFVYGTAQMLVASGDITGDGITDVVVMETSGPTAEVLIGQGTGGIGNGGFSRAFSQWYCASPTVCVSNDDIVATALSLVDLDGDAYLDLLLGMNDGTLALLPGTGADGLSQNSFVMPAESYALPPLTGANGTTGIVGAITGIAVGDLVGDASADVALATGSGVVAVFAGGATGGSGPTYSFTFVASASVGATAGPILMRDVDQDGRNDLIVAGDDTSIVSILRNELSSAVPALTVTTLTYPTYGYPMALALLDVDADGVSDLAVSTPREVRVFTGAPVAPYFTLRDVLDGPEVQSQLFVGDVNADGFEDLIATEYAIASTHKAVECYFGRGAGLGTPMPFYTSHVRSLGTTIGLFNQDDVPDVAFVEFDSVNYGPGLRVKTLLSNKLPLGPLPHFAPERGISLAHERNGLDDSRVRAGDFDGDGIVDLAYVGPSVFGGAGLVGEVGVMMGKGRFGFGSGDFAPAVLSFTDGAPPSQLEVADLNHDALSDLVLVRDAELVVALSTGSASFVAASVTSLAEPPSSLRIADVSGDGIHDLLLGYQGTSGLEVFLGNGQGGVGDGSFAVSERLDTGTFFSTTTLTGDFTGDRVTDIIVRDASFAGPGPAYLLQGSGGGAFLSPTALAGVDLNPHAVAVDLNRDGILDLVSSGGFGGSLSVQLGQGSGGVPNGTFAPVTTYAGHPQISEPGPVVVTDADLDGVLDLVAFTLDKREIMLLRGQSQNGAPTGAFAPSEVWLTSSGLEPTSLVVRDFNGDAIPDWAVMHNKSRLISLWYGQHQAHQPFAQAVRTGSGFRVQAYGAAVAEPDVGLMGQNLGAKSVIMMPAFTEAHSAAPDFWNTLLRSGLALPPGLTAITDPWLIDGFERVRRVSAPPEAPLLGARLRVFNRFGPLLSPSLPERAGLDLDAGRGLIVSLPLNRRYDHQTLSAAVGSGKVRVFKEGRRLVRSDEVALDPANDPRLLPRVGGSTPHDLIAYTSSFSAVLADDDGAFTSGATVSERFIVSLEPLGHAQPTTDAAEGFVRVLLNEPGTLQAFLAP